MTLPQRIQRLGICRPASPLPTELHPAILSLPEGLRAAAVRKVERLVEMFADA